MILSDLNRTSVTVVSDEFIEHHMPRANGEFVKIYLYLLHRMKAGCADIDIASVADVFSCTENDILRALRYWEAEGVLKLSAQEPPEAGPEPEAGRTAGSGSSRAAAGTSAPAGSEDNTAGSDSISNTRLRQLKSENEDVQRLLYVTEKYLGHPLTTADMRRIVYLYDGLHFSADMVEYLVEYCISRGNTNVRYIEAVGRDWHKDGILTPEAAKERTKTWNRSYFAILSDFGIRNRNPIPAETEYMDRWLKEYSFSPEIIREACSRTIQKTGNAQFSYADSILKNWYDNNIRTMEDIKAADAQHYQEQQKARTASGGKASGSGKNAGKKAAGQFNEFHQREYDYESLQKDLLNKQLGKSD